MSIISPDDKLRRSLSSSAILAYLGRFVENGDDDCAVKNLKDVEVRRGAEAVLNELGLSDRVVTAA